MPLDALTLVSRVVERAAQKCGAMAPAALALEEGQREDMLVDTLAGQLVGYLGMGGDGGDSRPGSTAAAEGDLERICADQLARNRRLARALGACDCWGELPGCDLCGGYGTPGWRRPHRASFDALVRPVIRRMQHATRRGASPRAATAVRMSGPKEAIWTGTSGSRKT